MILTSIVYDSDLNYGLLKCKMTRLTESLQARIRLTGMAVGGAHGLYGCHSWRTIWKDGQWAQRRPGRSQLEKSERVEEKGERGEVPLRQVLPLPNYS